MSASRRQQEAYKAWHAARLQLVKDRPFVKSVIKFYESPPYVESKSIVLLKDMSKAERRAITQNLSRSMVVYIENDVNAQAGKGAKSVGSKSPASKSLANQSWKPLIKPGKFTKRHVTFNHIGGNKYEKIVSNFPEMFMPCGLDDDSDAENDAEKEVKLPPRTKPLPTASPRNLITPTKPISKVDERLSVTKAKKERAERKKNMNKASRNWHRRFTRATKTLQMMKDAWTYWFRFVPKMNHDFLQVLEGYMATGVPSVLFQAPTMKSILN